MRILDIPNDIIRIYLLLTETKTKALDDLDAGRILNTLVEWRKRGSPAKRKGRKRTPMNVETSIHYPIVVIRARLNASRDIQRERTKKNVRRFLFSDKLANRTLSVRQFLTARNKRL